MRVELSRETFELIVANRLAWAMAIEKEQAEIDGSDAMFNQFLSFFDGWKVS